MYIKERILDLFDRSLRRGRLITPALCIACAREELGTQMDQLVVNERGFNYFVVIANDEIVFRFPRNRVAVRELQREAGFLERFAPQTSVPVPHIALAHNHRYSLSFGRYAYLPGNPLSASESQMLSHYARTVLIRRLGAFLVNLHSFPVRAARATGVHDHHMLRWMRKDYKNVQRRVLPRLTEAARAWGVQLFSNWCAYVARTKLPQAVIHADFREEHILVHQGALSGIIDFGDVKISDPALDFSFLLEYGDDFVEEALKCYTLPHDQEFTWRMHQYARLRRLIVPAYLLLRGRQTDAERMLGELPDYIKNNPL